MLVYLHCVLRMDIFIIRSPLLRRQLVVHIIRYIPHFFQHRVPSSSSLEDEKSSESLVITSSLTL
jgi:hypothetical protein